MRKMKTSQFGNRVVLVMPVVLLVAGCANIPRESVELSQTLGKQIQTLESTQEATIQAFFKDKREAARRLMQDKWIPQFADNYLRKSMASPKDAHVWEQTCGEMTATVGEEKKKRTECLRVIMMVSEKAEEKIQLRYRQLLDPLNKTENTLLTAVRADYLEAEQENSAITALLVSATKVEAERRSMLAKLGVSERQINGALAAVSVQVANVANKTKSVNLKLEDYAAKMKKIREIFSGTKAGA